MNNSKPTTTHTALAIGAFNRGHAKPYDKNNPAHQEWIAGWIVGFRAGKRSALNR